MSPFPQTACLGYRLSHVTLHRTSRNRFAGLSIETSIPTRPILPCKYLIIEPFLLETFYFSRFKEAINVFIPGRMKTLAEIGQTLSLEVPSEEVTNPTN